MGANSYILKPVEFNRFVHVVEMLAEYWLDLNESYA
jgi:two-component system response regulator